MIHTNIVVWSLYHLRRLENMAFFVPCFQLHCHAQPHLPTKPKFLSTQTSFFDLWGILTDLAIAWSKQTVMGLSLLAGTKDFSFPTSFNNHLQFTVKIEEQKSSKVLSTMTKTE
jgi:hypothetical protein